MREPGIFEIMYNARAMRRLKPDPIPEPLLMRLIEAGIQAPTPSNTQAWRWVIVRDPEQKRRLAELNRVSVEAYHREREALEGAVSAEEAERARRTRPAGTWQVEHLHEVPAIIIACAAIAPSTPASERAWRGAVTTWPAVQNLLLAARALGLGATPTTLGLRDTRAVRELLALPDDIDAHCLIPVGYPMGRFGPVSRPPATELVRFDRWQ